VIDDFTDNDFTLNPEWKGDNTKFIVTDFQLKLQAPAEASAAYLSTPSEAINNAVWEFKLKLEFNPSSSNLAKIYLVSDQANLTDALNGYFVLVGDTPDEISLYKQTGTVSTKILDGIDASVNQSIVNVSIKVSRDNLGNWELFSDIGNTGTYFSEGTSFDNTFKTSTHFGVVCNYTSTRSDKFFFDNFNVTGDPYVDTDPPILLSIEVLSSQEILVNFNEVLDPVSANPLLYELNTERTNPNQVTIQADGQSIKLSFSQHFQNGWTHSLSLSGVKDIEGNPLTATHTFLYFQPVPVKTKDIIFTEVFADPSPQINLPDAEYVEIYNRSIHPINISGWKLSDGSSNAVLPDKIILPNTYWAITSTANVSKFGINGSVFGVANFPTLNNSSDMLTLKTPLGETLDSINYNLSWYRNIDKQEGGWSLELIDPKNPCGEEENWAASENENGGTPGAINSINANKPDLTGPRLTHVNVISSTQLLLTFNEKLEAPIPHGAVFSVSPNIEIVHYYFESLTLRSIVLELAPSIAARQLYTITIENLFDCNGNNIDSEFGSATFALQENAVEGDLLINEILFNPKPNGVDFVELYNASDKYINLTSLQIGNIKGGLIENTKALFDQDRIMAPSEYLVFTSNPNILKSNYPQGKEDQFLTISLPSFPDDEGSVVIVDSSNTIIDYLQYNKDFHSSFIKEEEGVSLERISFTLKTNTRENWTSANSSAGFATPGYINSSARPEQIIDVGQIEIDPPIFAPTSGGSVFSQIKFQFDQPGFIANVKIFDHQGRLIKTIANNEVLSYAGAFRWDGDTEDGNKARAGYYVVWFEVFNLLGSVQTYRKRVIVANR